MPSCKVTCNHLSNDRAVNFGIAAWSTDDGYFARLMTVCEEKIYGLLESVKKLGSKYTFSALLRKILLFIQNRNNTTQKL